MISDSSIIIDQYNKRPFLQRMVSDSATAMIWGLSSWLCKLHHLFQFRFLLLGIPNAVADPAVALISTASALTLFSTINSTKPDLRTVTSVDVARHFNMSEEQLNKSRNSQVCVVHHDEHGNITNIFSKISN